MTISLTRQMLGPIVALIAGTAGFTAIQPQLRAEEENVEVLTRGPVHEAFAEAVSYDAQPGVIVSMKVPAAIEEMPPEEQPDGDNVTWISGYWGWDDDQNNFIWISGVWRNLPPGRQWVPGYWNDLGDGRFQWISGYWASTGRTTVSYIPTAPPANIDNGPNIAAPSADHTWIPGNWYWTETRYVWRPGYWEPLRPNWCWVPPHYNWTPCGYVYVGGYWDHAVARRGVLFAPVYFRQPVYTAVSFSFVPAVVISLNVFSDHLFYRPYGHHYYFGDYYAPRYREAGFYASYTWTSGRRGYDPIYSYDRWEHRGDPNWERRRTQDFEYFRDHEDARPPRTWAAMQRTRADQFNDGRNRSFATPLEGYARQDRGVRFHKVDEKRRAEMVSQSREMRKFSQDRREIESRKVDDKSGGGKTVRREELKRSPVKSREVKELAENDTPPPKRTDNGRQGRGKAQVQPKPEPRQDIEPTPKKNKPEAEGGADKRGGKPVEPHVRPEPKPHQDSNPNPEGGHKNPAKDSEVPSRKNKPQAEGGPDKHAEKPAEPQARPQPKPHQDATPKREGDRKKNPQNPDDTSRANKHNPNAEPVSPPRKELAQNPRRTPSRDMSTARQNKSSGENASPKRDRANDAKRAREATNPPALANQGRGGQNRAENATTQKHDNKPRLADNTNDGRKKKKDSDE